MRIEEIVLNEERNVTLTAYLQDVKGEYHYVLKRPAILILPGGGYQYCSEREADPVAMPYLKVGYQVFILRYSVKQYSTWPNPLNDYEQAMELIRSKADTWNLYEDKIAVLGFSAGGHLAGCAATMAKNRPNAAILGYAVTKEELIKQCEPKAPDVIKAVDFHTCPCFIFATRTDQVVPVINSIEMMQALTEHGISFESHIYAYGPHGFTTGDPSVQYKDTVLCDRAPHWVEDSIAWLRDMFGEFGMQCMTEPICGVHVTADYDEVLSINCTFGYLRTYEKAKEVVEPVIQWLEEHKEETAKNIGQAAYELVKEQGMKGLYIMIDTRTLQEVLKHTQWPKEEVKQLDIALKEIENKR